MSTTEENFDLDALVADLDVDELESRAAAGDLDVPAAGLLPDERREVFVNDLPLDRLVAVAVDAMAAARIGSEPFVLRKLSTTGDPIGLVSINPDGSPRHWTVGQASQLVLAVIQPMIAKDEELGTATYSYSVPRDAAPAIFEAAMFAESIPGVRVISNAPVVLADGRVAATPGYNAAQEVLITIPARNRAAWVAGYSVPVTPTQDEAQAALEYVNEELLSDIPFDTDADRATAIAYLMTCATRYRYGTSPAFAFDAPERGTGKSLLAGLGRIIGQGHSGYQSIGYRKGQDAETWKQLGATALSGDRHIHIDELPRDDKITSTALSEVVTAPFVKTRLLGQNAEIVIEGLILTLAGNNVQLGLDFTRRFLKSRLRFVGDSAAYRRTGFRHPDLNAWATANRPALLAALHTITVHGIQQKVVPAAALGSYEGWTEIVMGALSAVTIEGESVAKLALDAQAELGEKEDDLAEEWGALLAYIHGGQPDEAWLHMSDIANRVVNAVPGIRPDLPEVLLPSAGQSAVGAARSWSRHFNTVRETPMIHGADRYSVHTKKDRNMKVFRVIKL